MVDYFIYFFICSIFFQEKARSSQRTTISRPQSLNTSSTISFPTAYHQKTSAYNDYNIERENDDYDFDDDSFNDSDYDDNMEDVIEAFNYNVIVKIYFLFFFKNAFS